MYKKEFSSFDEGLKALMALSWSAEQAVNHSLWLIAASSDGVLSEEARVTAALAVNVHNCRPGDGNCELKLAPCKGVRYTTGGGLTFGWGPVEEEEQWVFFIEHPLGAEAPGESSLLLACVNAGWEKISEWERKFRYHF